MKNTRFEGSTPGPWSANGDIGIVENKPGRAGFQIAAVSPIPGGREGNLSLIAAAPTLLERGQALAEALEIEMDGGGGRSAKSREAIAAWRAETRKETGDAE